MGTHEASETRSKAKAAYGVISEYALVFTIGLVGIALVRIWAFSNFDSATTLAVLSVVDRTSIILATVVVLVPSATFYLIITTGTLLPRIIWACVNHPDRVVALVAPLVGATLLVAVVSSASLFGFSLFALFVAVKFGVGRLARTKGRPQTKPVVSLTAVIIALSVTLSTSIFSPWVPRELVIVQDGRHITGYIVGAAERRSLVIDESKHAIWVQSDQIVSRSLCAEYVSVAFEPLSQFLARNRYETCPN
jgi:hypothetical protein